jgi:serine/threonine protein kinase
MAINQKPRFLGGGISCIVTTDDNKTALKGYEVWWNGKITGKCAEPCEERILGEDAIYTHLGEHPQILRNFGLEEVRPGVHSLRLELASLGCLRQYLCSGQHNKPSVQTRLRMTLDLAAGLQYMHSKGIAHADISTRNLFLFESNNGLRIKIGDLGGSIFLDRDDFKLDQCYEGRYTLPPRGREYDCVDIIKREIFALGCAIYEITAWEIPFSQVDSDEAEQM